MKLRTSLPAKVTAIFLAVISLLVGVVCVAGFIFAQENDFYLGQYDSYYDSDWCYNTAWNQAHSAYRWYLDGVRSSDLEGWYMQNSTNFGFQLVDTAFPQLVLLTNYLPEQAGFYEEFTFDGYTVRAYVASPLTAQDSFYRAMVLFDLLYFNRITVIVAGLVAGVVFLVSMVFLFCAVGHRRDVEGIVLNHQDKLPFDLYLALAVTAVVFLVAIPINTYTFSTVFDMILVVVLGILAFLVVLATLLTAVTRLKYGKFWRNTILYRVCRVLCRWLVAFFRWMGNTFHLLRITWRAALVFCAVTLCNVFLAAWFFGSGDFPPFLLGLLFNAFLLLVVCRVAMDLRKLQLAGERLAEGDFDYRVDTHKMLRDFREHADNLGSIGDGMAIAVEQRMKSERLKTELITNVSHDIKTPLTSIINYVDLLEKESLEGKASDYVEVLERQAKRLKKLTEDLVEASKASTGNISANLVRTGVCELVGQSLAEYQERLEAGRLDAVVNAPQEEVYVLADGRLLWRVFDNLLSNASKYSLGGSRLYIDIVQAGGEVAVSFKNISREQLNINADELMERFVRGDSARSTEGSGLGLNIARSLVELMGGSLSLTVDGDLFKAVISFRAVG